VCSSDLSLKENQRVKRKPDYLGLVKTDNCQFFVVSIKIITFSINTIPINKNNSIMIRPPLKT
jgi:hypothetical protein